MPSELETYAYKCGLYDAAGDVCMYCAGRVPGFGEAAGPTASGHWTHTQLPGTGTWSMSCLASPIYARLAALDRDVPRSEARRQRALLELIRLRAPRAVLVIVTQNYLGTLEGSQWRAIRRWAVWKIELALSSWWDSIRIWFLMRVLGWPAERASIHVFGSSFGSEDSEEGTNG